MKIWKRENHILFWCQGCDCGHAIKISNSDWHWNENYELPTITPSVLNSSTSEPKEVCHVIVTDGKINYLADCTHSFANQILPLKDISETYGF